MKFLCPSCKAKYQLADEKVAGRSVRMRCRKCGHMIQISARDAIHEANSGVSEAEVVSTTSEPPASSPLEAPRGSWADAMTNPAELDDDETTAIVQPKTIAAAMAAAKRAAAAPQEPAADGWFVGINGVPVGPIKLSELRSKAATGAITLESLTWRESCDEWRPLRTFPELAELVEQVQAEALRTAARIAKARSEQQAASASRSVETAMQARQAAASRVAELALAQAARMTPAPPAPVTAAPAPVTAAPAPVTAAPAPVTAAPAPVTAAGTARPPRPGIGGKSPGAAASAKVLVTPAPSRPGEARRSAQDSSPRPPGAAAPPPPSSRNSVPSAAPAVAAPTATPQPASARAVPPAKPATVAPASKASPSVAAERAAGLSPPAPRVGPITSPTANAANPAALAAGAPQTVSTASGADAHPVPPPSAAPAPVPPPSAAPAPVAPFATGALAATAAAGARPSFTIPDPFVSVTTPATLGGAAAPLRVAAEPVDSQLLGTAMRQSSPLKPVALAVLLLAAGLAAGFFLFSPGERAPVAAAPTPSVAPPAEATVALPSIPPPEAAAPSAVPGPVERAESGGRARPGVRPPPKPEGESKLTGDLRNLGSGPSPTEGPRAAPAFADTPPPGTELGAGQLQSTVAKYTGGVKRSCWQPALDTRDKDAPTSARVNVTITVAPSGNVQDVSTSGDPRGYPGLASCIAGRVRGWQFPAASASTTLNVPFVFAAQ
jgi:predicted Zn finger-like uncharacterized protein